MRRARQQLTDQECSDILDKAYRGFLSVIGDGGYPYTVPINFYHEDGKIYFHSAKEGHKIDALRTCDKACFTALAEPEKEPGDWWYHVRSVVCFGRIAFVEDAEEHLSKLRLIGGKYFPESYDMDSDIQKNGPRAAILDMRVEHMTGKRVKEN